MTSGSRTELAVIVRLNPSAWRMPELLGADHRKVHLLEVDCGPTHTTEALFCPFTEWTSHHATQIPGG